MIIERNVEITRRVAEPVPFMEKGRIAAECLARKLFPDHELPRRTLAVRAARAVSRTHRPPATTSGHDLRIVIERPNA